VLRLLLQRQIGQPTIEVMYQLIQNQDKTGSSRKEATVDFANVEKYMRALRRAQMELDLRPEPYKHYFQDMIPGRYRDKVDVRRFSQGERIVFLPYTEDAFRRTQN
jgi:hypothetical protein